MISMTKNITSIIDGLATMYPDAHCELDYRNPFELLIATILSAQATDVQVNKITKTLFVRYPTPEAFLVLSEEELAEEIRGIGLFRNKSKHILQTCFLLVKQYGGDVPRDRQLLEQLPGVGRKTANVVLSNAFHIAALAVDTHVQRVSNRLGLVQTKTPLETELALTDQLPADKWSDVHHQLIWHGRRVCLARKPRCASCPLITDCTYAQTTIEEAPQKSP